VSPVLNILAELLVIRVHAVHFVQRLQGMDE
jgi:hypothetical protein